MADGAIFVPARGREDLSEALRLLLGLQQQKQARQQAQDVALLQQGAGFPIQPGSPEAKAFQRVTGRPPKEGEIFGDFQGRLNNLMSVVLAGGELPTAVGPGIPQLLQAAVTREMGFPSGTTLEAARGIAGGREAAATVTKEAAEAARTRFNTLPEETKANLGFMGVIFDVVPSEAEVKDMDANLRKEIIEKALQVFSSEQSDVARLFQSKFGISFGSAVASAALGMERLLALALTPDTTDNAFMREEAATIRELAQKTGLPFGMVREVQFFRTRNPSARLEDVPDALKEAWLVIETAGAAAFNDFVSKSIRESPEFQIISDLLALGRQIDPDSPEWRSLANAYLDISSLAIAKTSPDWPTVEKNPELRRRFIDRIKRSGFIPSMINAPGLFATGTRAELPGEPPTLDEAEVRALRDLLPPEEVEKLRKIFEEQ